MRKIIYPVLMVFFSAMLAFAWSEKPRYELENNIVRLHILADGNGEREQAVKLLVRDELLKEARSRGRVLTLGEMESAANRTLKSAGESYTASVSYERCSITRRSYEDFILPEGRYTAVRVILGSGEGKNWWCVLSPPLCFTKSALGRTDELENHLSGETEKIIKADRINVKLRVLEYAARAAERLGIDE